jgi:prophage regulatory protein
MTTDASPIPQGAELLKLAEVTKRTHLSRKQIFSRVAKGEFPAPVDFGGRARFWPAGEVQAWIDQRFAARARASSSAA